MNKRISISLLILPIFFWAILCCCLESSAVAAPAVSVGHCHASGDQASGTQSHPPESDECQCHENVSLSSRTYDFQLAAGSPRAGEYHPVVLGLNKDISQELASQTIVCHGPPRQRLSAVPVCLRHSVLRL